MYPELTPPLLVMLGMALALAASIALRRPFLRRLALRQVARRRGEAALVVAGSVLGTAIIVGSLVVGDTLDFSVRQVAYDALGPVDEVVSSPTVAQGDEAARRVEALRGDPDVDGLQTLRGDRAAVAVDGGSGRAAEPQAGVWEVDFAAAAAFSGGAEGGSGLTGPAPGAGEVVLNDLLAGRLGASPGGTVTIHLYGRPIAMRVARVVPTTGIAGLGGTDAQVASPNAFLPPGTLTRLARTAEPGGTPAGPRTVTLVSNTGGVEEGARRTGAVEAKLRSALGPLTERGTSVDGPKLRVLDAAETEGNDLGSLFLLIGSFSIIAGVLLLVNIFVMLAEERKAELGMLRAIGMKRGRLVLAFLVEGTVYALLAALLGVAAGLAVGRAVMLVAQRVFSGLEGGALAFAFAPTSLVNGFAMGFLVAFVTVALTSVRISRVNIIAAIRDLSAGGGRRLARRWVVLSSLVAAGFTALSVMSVAGDEGTGAFLFPALAVLAACPALLRLASRRRVYTGASVAVLGWTLAAGALRPALLQDGATTTFVLLGTLLTFSAVFLVSQNQELLARPLRWLTARRPSTAGLALRLALAYPLARRFRTGAILVMYGLVTFTLVLVTVLGSLVGAGTEREVARASGGFDLRVDLNPSTPVEDPARALTSGRFAGRVEAVAPLLVAGGQVSGLAGQGAPLDAVVVGTGPALHTTGPLPLAERLDRLGDDRAVWRALQADQGYVILDPFLGQTTGAGPTVAYGPGDTLTLTDPATGRAERKVVAGVLASGFGLYGVGGTQVPSLVIMGEAAAREQFGAAAVPSAALVAAADGVADQALAADLQGQFLTNGLTATSIRDQVERGLAASRGFIELMQGFLALGLLVGVTGLGVVMVRAVRERRRGIGVLRALGFPAGTIRLAFLAESAFVALEGIVIGATLSVITSYLMFRNDETLAAGVDTFPVPWPAIAALVLVTAAASVAATALPARRAAAIRPAVALRLPG